MYISDRKGVVSTDNKYSIRVVMINIKSTFP